MPGKTRPRWRWRRPAGNGAFISGAAPEDQPDAEPDQQDRPDDVEPEPPQHVEVVQEEVDPDHHEDQRPEVLPAPRHGGPILTGAGSPGRRQTGATTSNSPGRSLRASATRSAPATVACTPWPSTRYRVATRWRSAGVTASSRCLNRSLSSRVNPVKRLMASRRPFMSGDSSGSTSPHAPRIASFSGSASIWLSRTHRAAWSYTSYVRTMFGSRYEPK